MPEIDPPAPLTVDEYIASLGDILAAHFPRPLLITGEVTNASTSTRGHCYFSLKGTQSAMDCVIFARALSRVRDLSQAAPANGDVIDVLGSPSLYAARGQLQFNVVNYRKSESDGEQFARYVALKKTLAQRGYFDSAHKKPIPAMPRRIGVVTSSRAAALRDILATLHQRCPSIPVIIYPCAVHGADAPAEIVSAIDTANARGECDVLILARGGGSPEDLAAFNDAAVAEAVFNSTIPIASGVGHEEDEVIADFVADIRAITPTAAAAAVCPSRDALLGQLSAIGKKLHKTIGADIRDRRDTLTYLRQSIGSPKQLFDVKSAQLAAMANLSQRFMHLFQTKTHALENLVARITLLPARRLTTQRNQLALCQQQISLAAGHLLAERRSHLQHLQQMIRAINPMALLKAGYAIVSSEKHPVITSSEQLALREVVSIRLYQNRVRAQITELATDTTDKQTETNGEQ